MAQPQIKPFWVIETPGMLYVSAASEGPLQEDYKTTTDINQALQFASEADTQAWADGNLPDEEFFIRAHEYFTPAEAVRMEKIVRVKVLRQGLDRLEQSIMRLAEPPYGDGKDSEDYRTLEYARKALQESRMWLGMNLQANGNPHPYPNGLDTSTAIVDAPADKNPTPDAEPSSTEPSETADAPLADGGPDTAPLGVPNETPPISENPAPPESAIEPTSN